MKNTRVCTIVQGRTRSLACRIRHSGLQALSRSSIAIGCRESTTYNVTFKIEKIKETNIKRKPMKSTHKNKI